VCEWLGVRTADTDEEAVQDGVRSVLLDDVASPVVLTPG